ncbi:MAG: hypothetical protein C4325_04580 [Blastocatellia bacterium]
MPNQVFNNWKIYPAQDDLADRHTDRGEIGDVWTKYHMGATVGLLGGLVVLLSAVVLTAFEYFSDEKSHSFWLFLAVYPLFALGAHCLDKISEMKRESKNISHEDE